MSMLKKMFVSLLVIVMFLMSFGATASFNRYNGAGVTVDYNEVISFSRKVENTTKSKIGLPNYNGASANGCVPFAGSIVLGRYDIFKDNLIPNFQAATYYNGIYYYNGQDGNVNAVTDTLYSLMGTNIVGAGTSVSEYKNGMTNYVNGKGYSISYESVMQGGFNSSLYINKINEDKPVALFINGFIYAFDYTESSGKVTILGQNSGNRHACVGYGYKTINYFRNESKSVWAPVWYNPFRRITVTEEVNFRNDTYLLVSFGDYTKGMLLVNDLGRIEDAFAVVI